jgi:undecaprenyl-diphosphatase
MHDRQAFRLILWGSLLFGLGLACWWFGADPPLHTLLRLSHGSAAAVGHLSALGGLLFMGPLAAMGVALLLWLRRKIDALWLLVTITTGRLAVEGLKLALMRPRPPRADWLEIVQSWSFPSSHSAGTIMTCIALALLFGRRRWSMAGALLAAGVIGWTRVALAVHWPSDVLAGWGFGMLWLGLSLGVYATLSPEPAPLRPVADG